MLGEDREESACFESSPENRVALYSQIICAHARSPHHVVFSGTLDNLLSLLSSLSFTPHITVVALGNREGKAGQHVGHASSPPGPVQSFARRAQAIGRMRFLPRCSLTILSLPTATTAIAITRCSLAIHSLSLLPLLLPRLLQCIITTMPQLLSL